MKREKKLATAMVSLFIDDEQKKLSDKYNDLKLSHNRKVKLLKDIKMSINNNSDNVKADYAYFLVNLIDRELLYPYKRCNWGYTHKQEPGHYCE